VLQLVVVAVAVSLDPLLNINNAKYIEDKERKCMKYRHTCSIVLLQARLPTAAH